MLKISPKEHSRIKSMEQVGERKYRKWKVTTFHTRAAVQRKSFKDSKDCEEFKQLKVWLECRD